MGTGIGPKKARINNLYQHRKSRNCVELLTRRPQAFPSARERLNSSIAERSSRLSMETTHGGVLEAENLDWRLPTQVADGGRGIGNRPLGRLPAESRLLSKQFEGVYPYHSAESREYTRAYREVRSLEQVLPVPYPPSPNRTGREICVTVFFAASSLPQMNMVGCPAPWRGSHVLLTSAQEL